jgi:probable rRNA maturation factor
MNKPSLTTDEQLLDLDIQRVFFDSESPSDEQYEHWVMSALQQAALDQPERSNRPSSQLAIRIVDEEEGARLNEQWRHKKGATNVLSFAMSGLDLIAPEILGDIVICAPVVRHEAEQQTKTLHAHWAHMVVHGVLHLLGYDHTEDAQAEVMERLEIKILKGLDYADPYQTL